MIYIFFNTFALTFFDCIKPGDGLDTHTHKIAQQGVARLFYTGEKI